MGRKKKEVLSDEQMEELVISKYMNHEPMTLDEAAYALWMADGKKTAKPMTKVGLLKIETKALAKLKVGLAKFGIKSLDDVIDLSKSHRAAKICDYGVPVKECED